MTFEKISSYHSPVDYVEDYLFPIFPDDNGKVDYEGSCIAQLKPQFINNNVKLEKIKIVNGKLPDKYDCIVGKRLGYQNPRV